MVLLAACGSVEAGGDDNVDAGGKPDAVAAIDAGRTDATPIVAPTNALDTPVAAGTVSGLSHTMSFQLGAPVFQGPSSAGDTKLTGNPAVIP
jgi:hypothetical protein